MLFRILPSNDQTVGFNNFCQENANLPLDKSICNYERFDKVVFFYIDGMPKYLASILEDNFPKEFISLSIDNPGLADSGPFYRNF